MITLALLFARLATAYNGPYAEAPGLDFESDCAAELTTVACGDTGTALDYAYDVCENTTQYGTPSAVVMLCAEALVSARDAGIGFARIATEF